MPADTHYWTLRLASMSEVFLFGCNSSTKTTSDRTFPDNVGSTWVQLVLPVLSCDCTSGHLVISKGKKLSSAALRFLGRPLSNKIPEFFARPAIRIDAALKAKGSNAQYWCDLDFPFVRPLKNTQSALIFWKQFIATRVFFHICICSFS